MAELLAADGEDFDVVALGSTIGNVCFGWTERRVRINYYSPRGDHRGAPVQLRAQPDHHAEVYGSDPPQDAAHIGVHLAHRL